MGDKQLKQVGISYSYRGYLIDLDINTNNFRICDEHRKILATSTKGYKSKNKSLSKAQNLINIFEDKIRFFK